MYVIYCDLLFLESQKPGKRQQYGKPFITAIKGFPYRKHKKNDGCNALISKIQDSIPIFETAMSTLIFFFQLIAFS